MTLNCWMEFLFVCKLEKHSGVYKNKKIRQKFLLLVFFFFKVYVQGSYITD